MFLATKPAEVVDRKIAEQMLNIAKLMTPKKGVSILEMEPWIKHMRPVKGAESKVQKKAIAALAFRNERKPTVERQQD